VECLEQVATSDVIVSEVHILEVWGISSKVFQRRQASCFARLLDISGTAMTAHLNDECPVWQPESATATRLAEDPVGHRTQKAMKLLLGLLNTLPDSQPPPNLVSRTIGRVEEDAAARKRG